MEDMKKEVGFLDAFAGVGFEHMSNEDFAKSFLTILQSLSPQCVKGKDEYMEEAEPGLFYNQANGRVYGKTLKVIPLFFKRELLEFKPDRGGFVGKHDPDTYSGFINKDDFSEWKAENGNILTESYTFMFALPDYPEDGLVIYSAKSTNIKPARSFNSMIGTVRLPSGKPAPYFSSVWELTTVKRESNNNTWYTIGSAKVNAQRVGFISKEQHEQLVQPLFTIAKALDIDHGVDSSTRQIEGTVENTDY